MIEICKLAQEKGFTPKTVSTQVTFRNYTENGKNLMINDMCRYLLLCEIQFWAREKLSIDVRVCRKYRWYVLFEDRQYYDEINYSSYREALEAGLKEILE